jgi:hypothetical protein
VCGLQGPIEGAGDVVVPTHQVVPPLREDVVGPL